MQRNPLLRTISMRKEGWRKNRLGIRETLLPPSSLPFLSSPSSPSHPSSPVKQRLAISSVPSSRSSPPPVNGDPRPRRHRGNLLAVHSPARNFALGGNVHDLYAPAKTFRDESINNGQWGSFRRVEDQLSIIAACWKISETRVGESAKILLEQTRES